MVKPSRRLCAVFLACWAGASAAQDVAGVRIGMSKEQAVRAAIDRLHVSFEAVRFAPDLPELPPYFVVATATETLTVHFASRLPFDAQSPPVVDRVTYEMPRTARNEAAMKQAALLKYGAPANGTRGFNLQWCARSTPNPAYYAIGCLQAPGPVLTLDGTRIELSAPRSGDAATQDTARQLTGFTHF